ncbi:spore coat putative kinase YutH [Anaerobacillus alkaliphilus]|uniref:spore coat putative kinase YutH n=1 Tax=Anaerobacillus alkaliphilus TaxID=1548597 RepID=UPI001375D042|nr:spore coat protein YutH [Anaerobacillus alkaliphilus]
MFERNIFDEYKLYCEQRFVLGEHEGFTAKNNHYIVVCVDQIEDHEIKEMVNMGNHLTANGDHEIATFIPTIKNTLTSFVDGQNCILLQLPRYVSRSKMQKSLGYELARLHRRGKTFQSGNREGGTWSQFWLKRLNQLEMLYVDLSKQPKKYSFDQAFMISFPYYLGRTETAIQYMVDSNLDFGQQIKQEPKTICHYQFSPNTWLTYDEKTAAGVKSPIEFVYDYPSRDLSEWMRVISRQDAEPYRKINEFIRGYETVETISPISWRYIYGRLLFPIDYFRIVEGYYRSIDDEEAEKYTDQLFELLGEEKKTEAFLRDFHQTILPQHHITLVPQVDWLRREERPNSSLRNTYNHFQRRH